MVPFEDGRAALGLQAMDELVSEHLAPIVLTLGRVDPNGSRNVEAPLARWRIVIQENEASRQKRPLRVERVPISCKQVVGGKGSVDDIDLDTRRPVNLKWMNECVSSQC